MFRKSLYVFCLLAVLLSACANAAQTQPPVQSTPLPQDTAPQPTAYPGAGEGNAPMAQPPIETPAQAMPYPGSEGEPVNVAPVAGDENMSRGPAFVDKGRSMVLVQEGANMQVTLILRGNLPNPCYQLRVVPGKPNEENRIDVEAYSVAPKDLMCADMLQPFDVQVQIGSFEGGKYTLYVNGELISEFGK